jgi:RNA polymerase sigma-70 factor (ECF subfamily)
VAEVVGIGVQAVKSRLHRARLLVRAQLEPLLGLPVEPVPAEGTCPDVIALFSRHLEGEISAGVCAEMEQHMRQCARCRNACDSLGRTLALCHAAGAAAEVPASVQASVKLGLRDLLGGRA